MDVLQRVEEKIDVLSTRDEKEAANPGGTTDVQQESHPLVDTPVPMLLQSDQESETPGHYELESSSVQRGQIHTRHRMPRHLTVPHLVFMWPRIYSNLVATQPSTKQDLQSILHEGLCWFARKEAMKHKESLPVGLELPGASRNISSTALAFELSVVPTSHFKKIKETSDAYFDTFNLVYPILDQDHFVNTILEVSLRKGCIDGGAHSAILLSVLALGEVSIQGNAGAPIGTIDGRPSGFRGGSIGEPPGLMEFNEARRRMAFLSVDCTIEYVQIMLLQSIYYESHARHIEYWRCVTLASSAVQGLRKLQSVDWTSFYGDQVKRAFWTCVLQEDFFHISLDLPGTDIHEGEADVPMPHFRRIQDR
jgi:hypothetical protein